MTTPAPEARALSESALVDVFAALRHATDPTDFLARADAIVMAPQNLLPLATSRGTPDPLEPSGSRGIDVRNAPSVHEYIGELDRANAADARLWSYLALATYRSYMEERWPLVESPSKPDAWRRRVQDRWLLHSGSVNRGRLVRHGIARLWWVAHLTYLPKTYPTDPYFLTREVFKNEDRLNAIYDREVGAIPQVMFAVLEHAADKGNDATDKYVQKVMEYLTVVHGFRDVGALERDEINGLVEVAAKRATSALS